MCSARSASVSSSASSATVKMRSNRETRAGSRSICSAIGSYSWKRPSFGLAAPSSEHLDFSVALMPAFEMEMELWQTTPSLTKVFVGSTVTS
jgi:hypothetical protein